MKSWIPCKKCFHDIEDYVEIANTHLNRKGKLVRTRKGEMNNYGLAKEDTLLNEDNVQTHIIRSFTL